MLANFSIVYRLNRCLALFTRNFSHQLRHEVAGQALADFFNKRACVLVAHFKMRNAVCMVQLVQVVGENPLLEQPTAQSFERIGAVVHALQEHALV